MTFGNAVELILSIVALMKRLYDVVTYSLIGSVLSNLLLVLGKLCCHSELRALLGASMSNKRRKALSNVT